MGVAPIYNRLPLYIRLKNQDYEERLKTDIDICKWVEGRYTEKIDVLVPCDMACGNYELQIGIGGDDLPSVVFATNAKQDGVYSVLTEIIVRD